MKKKLFFIFGRWAILSLVVVAVIGGFYLLGAMRGEPTISERWAPTATPLELPSQWKVYRNELDGYQIKYPNGWFSYPAREAGSGADFADTDISKYELVPSPTDTAHIRVNIIALENKEGAPLGRWLALHDKEVVFAESSVSVGGLAGTRRIESSSEFLQLKPVERAIAMYLPYGDRVLRIIAFPDNSLLVGTFEVMLQTLTLLR